MFDGVPEQLHQFIASSRTTLPLPSLSFSSIHHHHHHHHHQHGSSNPNNISIFPSFDPFTSTTTTTNSSAQIPVLQVQPSFLHPFNDQQSQPQKSSSDQEKLENDHSLVGMSNNLEIDIERSENNNNPASWSNDEVLALLRVRSSLDNWFPESTWEHVSRKLEELGYKRSAEKCKEKFEEEESRYLSNINYCKSHRFFNEFEDFYSNNHEQNPEENNKKLDKPIEGEEEEEQQQQPQQDKNLLDGLRDENLVNPSEDVSEKLVASKGKKKRKRVQKKTKDGDDHFEMLKGFCEDIVKKMMVQQEEMHHKLIEDMVKRDEEKVAREEAWKKQEMDRINKELESRAHEQAIAGDRQATLIKFLKSFTSISSISRSSSSSHDHDHHQNQCFEDQRSSEESPVRVPINSPSPSLILAQNPNDQVANHEVQNPSSNILDNPKEPTSQNPNSTNIPKKKPLSPTSVSTQNPSSSDRDDIGKRWPRDEVFALINLRCSLHNNGSHDHQHHHQDKEGQAKIPLWERISQGMLELGYRRSAKRCKEKWENINKYFRKTKDVNKKRSLDSRTCPYFHQLSTLYNQGTLVAPSEAGNRSVALRENHSTPSENHPGSSQGGSSSDSTMHVGHEQQGEKILVQVPTFDFEF